MVGRDEPHDISRLPDRRDGSERVYQAHALNSSNIRRWGDGGMQFGAQRCRQKYIQAKGINQPSQHDRSASTINLICLFANLRFVLLHVGRQNYPPNNHPPAGRSHPPLQMARWTGTLELPRRTFVTSPPPAAVPSKPGYFH